jgi:hypothetical protein
MCKIMFIGTSLLVWMALAVLIRIFILTPGPAVFNATGRSVRRTLIHMLSELQKVQRVPHLALNEVTVIQFPTEYTYHVA